MKIIAEQDLIIFGKLIKKGEKINNIFLGVMKNKEEILNKLKEKKYKYKIIEDKEDKEDKNDENGIKQVNIDKKNKKKVKEVKEIKEVKEV